MNIFILLFVTFLVHAAEKACKYGDKNDCPKETYCIHYEQGKDLCKPKTLSEIHVLYPFSPSVKSFCDQGVLSPEGNSHTWHNTAFAVDIKSEEKVAPQVLAGITGIAIVHSECKTQNDQCGNGFGNQVKILSDHNVLVFYAHLEKTFVKTGDQIKVGTVIGTEGTTGWTGKDNRHLHLSVHRDWKAQGFEYWKGVGYLPASQPFKIIDCNHKAIDVETLDCRRVSKNPYHFCQI